MSGLRSAGRRAWAATLAVCVSLATITALAVPPAAGEGAAVQSPETYFVPDVPGQFKAIANRADATGFYIGDSPDPSACKHYQGIARSTGPGTPYFFVTRSGIHTFPGCPFDDDDPANLLIVRMGSRDTTGERLRSNRLARGIPETYQTSPPAVDTTVAFISFDGTNGWPNYGHAGGTQLVGDVLAVPLESPYGNGPDNLILFIDVSDPEHPTLKSTFDPGTHHDDDWSAAVVAVAREPGGRYLMLITGKSNEFLRIYRSNATEDDGSTDLKDPGLDWDFLDEWSEADDEADLGSGADWPTGGPHQTLNFVREGDENGQLFLAGARNTTNGLAGGEDWIDLYRVEFEESQFKLRFVANRHLTALHVGTTVILGSGDIANFAAADGFYVSPSGELLFYATTHDNSGSAGDVLAGEWRSRRVVRPDSPTLNPTAEAAGPFQVGEGNSVVLSGFGRAATTKAWMELFADPNFTDRSELIDYPDWAREDFDDFKRLDPSFNIFHPGFSDQASSMRWFAPVGCTVRINDDDFGDSNFPGRNTLTLAGTGKVEELPDFSSVQNDSADGDIDDEITSAQFLSDCDAYYNAPLQVSWDLDRNGSFETAGTTATFSAASLDGPTDITVPMQATHPTDGRFGPGSATVHVTNQPPVITGPVALDDLNHPLGAGAPALAGLPVRVQATFTDPGVADTHTATLDWGDGTVVPDTGFDGFADSTGGVTGSATDSHVYTTAGTYNVVLRVEDDDGGASQATVTIQVLDATAAVQSVIDRIDQLLKGATDPDLVKALRSARDALDGSKNGVGINGAIDKLQAGDLEAALVKMKDAVAALEQAEAGGAGDLTDLKRLLGMAAWSVAQGAYKDAQTAVGPPSPGEQMQLDQIAQLIEQGTTLLAAGDYLGAIEAFRDAVHRSVALL